MGELRSYFFDTYAFFELINGNLNYNKYQRDVGIITTKLNLMELHYGLLKVGGEEMAEHFLDSFSKFCVEIDDEIIKEANKFRFINKSKKLSYIDCVGYIISKKFNVKFLTGDKEFENLENVEFVK